MEMEQDVEKVINLVCATCLSNDRNLISINGSRLFEMFKLLMSDFPGDIVDMEKDSQHQYVCWECSAFLKRLRRFKEQVQNAQKHLHILTLSSGHEGIDHTYMSESLSNLEVSVKSDYDKIFFDYSTQIPWEEQEYIINESQLENVKAEHLDIAQALRDEHNIQLEPMHSQMVEELVLDSGSGNISHILIREVDNLSNSVWGDNSQTTEYLTTATPVFKGEIEYSTLEVAPQVKSTEEKQTKTGGYTTEYMSEADMLEMRENAKLKVQYATAVYKCELCIIGFYNQQQVEDHFLAMHRTKPGRKACKICLTYVDEKKLSNHIDQHYLRYKCKLCDHVEYSVKIIALHMKAHMAQSIPNSVIKIGDAGTSKKKGRRKKMAKSEDALAEPLKPGDLRRLLSKKTIQGYQCLECDMFFKNSRARKNHVLRYHREGFQCEHCKKRFVNRTTLTTHLRLHEGPLPREECPICHKQVRVIQLKYHIQRHENKSRYECDECKKVFSHLTTFQAHLKYSRAHASDDVFKFPCPMCNKGYPTKEQMQDHFNYQHLGKTSHKCPICDKPIASRINVEKHMLRVHAEKKEKPRNHICQQCGKAFTDKKALTQHEVIHSGERPLVCNICQQTFKQKASLYTHKKRVHKVFPTKKVVEFIENKP